MNIKKHITTMYHKIYKNLFWTIVIMWMAIIFNLSSQVAAQSNQLSKGVTQVIVKTVEKVAPNAYFNVGSFNHMVRKNAHFMMYLILGILIIKALGESGTQGYRGVVWTLVICIVYALSDEVHQLFVPGRGAQITDVLIDSAGASMGVILNRLYGYIKKEIRDLY